MLLSQGRHRCGIVRCTYIVSESVKSSGFPTADDRKIEKRMRKWFANRCKGSGYKAGKKSKKTKNLINEMPVGAGNVQYKLYSKSLNRA